MSKCEAEHINELLTRLHTRGELFRTELNQALPYLKAHLSVLHRNSGSLWAASKEAYDLSELICKIERDIGAIRDASTVPDES
jgi:hypothetical protein